MSYFQRMNDTAGAKGLGLASIGIGLAELLATKQVQSLLGIDDTKQHRGVLRTLGVRELMHGVNILTERRDEGLATSVWARVAGDMLDNVLLGAAAKQTKKPGSFAAVAASVAVIGLLDFVYATRLSKRSS